MTKIMQDIECSKCNGRFKTKQALANHKKSHNKPAITNCNFCYALMHDRNIKRHLRYCSKYQSSKFSVNLENILKSSLLSISKKSRQGCHDHKLARSITT